MRMYAPPPPPRNAPGVLVPIVRLQLPPAALPPSMGDPGAGGWPGLPASSGRQPDPREAAGTRGECVHAQVRLVFTPAAGLCGVNVLAVAAVAAAGVAAGVSSAYLLAGEPAGLTPSAILEGGSPRLGDASAPVTIVEYGDYQCTYCYRFHRDTLPQLMEYVDAGRASIVFQDFALNGEDSVLAAEASRCAGEQGLYWQYHDQLYRNWGGERTGWVTRQALASFASEVGADAVPFERCLDDGTHRQAVLDAYERGGEMGIDATPSFLIFDGREVVKVRGNQPAEVFHRVMRDLGQT